jgi:hypothetical protein
MAQPEPQAGEDAAGLGIFQPVTITAPLCVGAVQVREVPLARLGAFARAAKPIVSDIDRAIEDPAELYGEHGEAMIELLAIGSGKDVAWVGALLHADALLLFLAILKANRSFFSRMLRSRRTPAAQTSHGTGQTPSPPSSPQATP